MANSDVAAAERYTYGIGWRSGFLAGAACATIILVIAGAMAWILVMP